MKLDKFKKYPLTFGITPIEFLPRLSKHIDKDIEIYRHDILKEPYCFELMNKTTMQHSNRVKHCDGLNKRKLSNRQASERRILTGRLQEPRKPGGITPGGARGTPGCARSIPSGAPPGKLVSSR